MLFVDSFTAGEVRDYLRYMSEIGEKDGDDIQEKTVVSQEVSLLGKRYRDTSLQVQGDRERQNQPQMEVRARREVVDWLVFKTDKGERPAVSWDKIKDIDQDAYKVDIINNNIVTSDTFEDINKNEIHKTSTDGESIQMYNQFEEHTNLDFDLKIPLDSNSSDQNTNAINLTDEQNNNITEDIDNIEDAKIINQWLVDNYIQNDTGFSHICQLDSSGASVSHF